MDILLGVFLVLLLFPVLLKNFYCPLSKIKKITTTATIETLCRKCFFFCLVVWRMTHHRSFFLVQFLLTRDFVSFHVFFGFILFQKKFVSVIIFVIVSCFSQTCRLQDFACFFVIHHLNFKFERERFLKSNSFHSIKNYFFFFWKKIIRETPCFVS